MSDDMELRIQQYVALRDKRDALKKARDAEIAKFDDAMGGLETYIKAFLYATRQESAKTKAGTAFLTTQHSATIADQPSFRRHVIGSQLWDLVDWRANKTEVVKLVDADGEPPPGVNYSSRVVVQIRRAAGDKGNE